MLWQVRALLPDRPGAMASLAHECGARGANILALDVHPAADGQVVDELVVHAPPEWTATDVERLCADAGVANAAVAECSARALEDQPVRYLRAAQALIRDPGTLEEMLCRMLEARPAEVDAATLVLDDGDGPVVSLVREVPFTATETARAAELRLVAAAALAAPSAPQGAPDRAPRGVGELRRGTVADIRALVELHERCSADTLTRRYHTPTPRLSPRAARALLLPADGFSLVLPDSDDRSIVAIGMVAREGEVWEAALLVEDRWQQRGHGTELLRALATEAARSGVAELTLLTRRDDTAVLATVHRAGLRAHVACADGVNRLRVPLTALADELRASGRPPRRWPTEPLVTLLHQRSELREIYPPAAVIDSAVRDGV